MNAERTAGRFNAPAPSPFRLWLVWAVAVLAYLIAVMNRASLSAVGVDTALRYDVDAASLSMFAVVQLLVYAAMQIPAGLLIDAFGARVMLVAGMFVMMIGQAALAFGTGLEIALFARVLLGAGDATIFPSVLRVVNRWFPPRQAPIMGQLTGMAGLFGQFLSLYPLAALLHLTSWQTAFLTVAGLSGFFGVLAAIVVRDTPPNQPVQRSQGSFSQLRTGFVESFRHPATRLAFWTHFVAPFSGTAFSLLWGVPFIAAGNGMGIGVASFVVSVFVVTAIVSAPLLGMLSSRMPLRRSYILLPIVAAQVTLWIAVIAWPGVVPLWLLIVLAFVLGLGGPASMIAFDHARAHNPSSRISTASGIVNSGGFIAALVVIFVIGVTLDALGAGTPETYRLDAFKIAFAMQLPVYALGVTMLLIERRKTRVLLGLDRVGDRRRRAAAEPATQAIVTFDDPELQ